MLKGSGVQTHDDAFPVVCLVSSEKLLDLKKMFQDQLEAMHDIISGLSFRTTLSH